MISINRQKNINFLKAISTFTGTIIGVGIFGLPYVAMKAGFLVVILYFVFLTYVSIAITNLYGQLSCDTSKECQIPGYAEEYIGKRAKKFSFIILSITLVGALLAYLIVGSDFLYSLLKDFIGGSSIIYTLIYFAAGAVLIYTGIKRIAQFEFLMLIVFFIILFFFLFKALPLVNYQNLTTFDLRFLTFPYGVVIFALSGLPVIPEIKEMVNRDQSQLKKVIIWGTIISAIAYLIFIFAFLGATGANTSKNAMSGFASLVGPKIILLGYLFGLITTFTSFITLGLTLKKMFIFDFGVSEKLSWGLACFTPLLIYFLGVKNFLDVIGLIGAIVLGIGSTLIIFIYRNFILKRFQRKTSWTIYLLLFFLLVGVVFEIIYFFIR